MHRDDTKLILFVDPYEEGLGLVMEDSTTFRPVTVDATCFKEAITLLEEEMVGDKLLLVLFGHAIKRVKSACKVTFKAIASINDGLHD